MARSDLEIIKKPYKVEKFSKKMEHELSLCMLDPIYFIEKYMMIQHPQKGRMLIELYEYQRNVIRSYMTHKNVISLWARQMGKCFNSNTIIKKQDQLCTVKEIVDIPLKAKLVDWLETILLKLSK